MTTASMAALALVIMSTALQACAVMQKPTECADGTLTLWMQNSNGENPCALVQDVLRVCQPSFELGFLPRGYSCDNSPGSTLAPCCCGSPTFALMSACWSCQYNMTFDLVSTTFTGFEQGCQKLPNPITTYDPSVRSSIQALNLPAWSQVEPLAGKWDFTGAWQNSTPYPTASPPVPTGYPTVVTTTGISKGALAGAIIGAILGSKLLFMTAGYVFWRWWKNQPGHQNQEDDEKGYVHRVLGEPRPGRRLPGRSRRGSRADIDLEEDNNTSPRSSRWLGVPSYLHPTSFHTPSSASESSHAQHNHMLISEEPGYGYASQVTPFIPSRLPAESEKRRQSTSMMRVMNAPQLGDTAEYHEGSASPPPQPALLARARTVSGVRSPLRSPPMLNPQSRSNSNTNSPSTSNLHGHTDSTGSLPHRYQEDDAGVSLVIEGSEHEPIRSVPPAYVDYRSSTHRLLERHGSQATAAGSSGEGYASGSGSGAGWSSAMGEGSRRAASDFGMENIGTGTNASTSTTFIDSPSTTDPPGVKKDDHNETDTADVKTMTDANTLREPARAEDAEEPETRDRTTSADSEGASTIKAAESLMAADDEPPQPVTRSSTTDLAALTAANTAANRSAGPSTPTPSIRPSLPTHVSAPTLTTTDPDDGDASHDSHDHNHAPPPTNHTPPSTDSGHSPTPSTWSWSRAMGVLGLTAPSGSGPDTGAQPQPPKA